MSSVNSSSTSASAAVLTSLPLLDALRRNPETSWTRPEGNNLDVLVGPLPPSRGDTNSINSTTTTITTQISDNNDDKLFLPSTSPLAIFNFFVILPFTLSQGTAIRSQHEIAAAVALAVHHMNVGDDAIVPQLKGLPERCNIRFMVECADTEIDASIAIDHILEGISKRRGIDPLPSSFIGSALSSVSIATSILTGIKGYPQVSAGSTSADLDDKNQSPLFARTIPSDDGNAIPILRYFYENLHVRHLAVLHINDEYGNAFIQSLRSAAETYAPEMKIFQASLRDDEAAIKAAVQTVRDAQYSYIFATVFEDETHDIMMEEAYRLGIAGPDSHRQWFFGDSFPSFENREFEINSPLHLAYRGAGIIEATGGIAGVGLDGYEQFIDLLSQLNNQDDMNYLASIFPNKYGRTLDQLDDFLTPATGAYSTFGYEAAIALGLAACDVAGSNASLAEDIVLDGKEHYQRLVNSEFRGINGIVAFNNETGSVDAAQSLYKIMNLIEEVTDEGKIKLLEETSILFREGQWEELQPFIYSDGTEMNPPDVPDVEIIDNVITRQIRVVVLLMCCIIAIMGLGCMLWTHLHRKSRVVLSSQPFFLHMICIGIIIMGCTIIPLSIDHGVAGSLAGATTACTASIWLIAMGFSITISALSTKTHRVNMISRSAGRMKRVKVTIGDVVKPMLALQAGKSCYMRIRLGFVRANHDLCPSFSLTSLFSSFSSHLVFLQKPTL